MKILKFLIGLVFWFLALYASALLVYFVATAPFLPCDGKP